MKTKKIKPEKEVVVEFVNLKIMEIFRVAKESYNLLFDYWKEFVGLTLIILTLELFSIAVFNTFLESQINMNNIEVSVKNVVLIVVYSFFLFFLNLLPFFILSKAFHKIVNEKSFKMLNFSQYWKITKSTFVVSIGMLLNIFVIFMMLFFGYIFLISQEFMVQVIFSFIIISFVSFNFLLLLLLTVVSGFFIIEFENFKYKIILDVSVKYLKSFFNINAMFSMFYLSVGLSILTLLFLVLILMTMGIGLISLIIIIPYLVIFSNLFIGNSVFLKEEVKK